MSAIEELANNVAADAAKNEKVLKVFLDPFTISIIVTVITEIIKLYMSCKKTPQATALSMQAPSLVERWRLRRVIRQHIDDDEAHKAFGGHLFGSMLSTVKNIEEKDVQAMFDEVA
jgi:hypothetical protein